MVSPGRVICAAVVAGIVVSGCAIPTQRDPSAIPPNRVPFGLLDHQLPTTTTTEPKASVPVKIYLLGPDHKLVAVPRVVQIPAPLKAVIISLLGGPSRREESERITTAIPSDVQVISVTVSKTAPLVTVNFNDAFGEITGSATELAVAQVVFTVVTQTSLDTGVLFEIGGQTISVPVGNGNQVATPVYLSQFEANLANAAN
jgi:hypothetical protein